MPPQGRLMGLDLLHGGHLSHGKSFWVSLISGYQTDRKKVSATATFFESLAYYTNPKTGVIDYDSLEISAKIYRPRIIITGGSGYCRLFDYKRMREIADTVEAYLVADMSHICGLIAGDVIPSPFDQADVVTTTTRKTLHGPRGAMIFYRKGLTSKTDKYGNRTSLSLLFVDERDNVRSGREDKLKCISGASRKPSLPHNCCSCRGIGAGVEA